MKTSTKRTFCFLVMFMILGPGAGSALAANRAYTALSAVLNDPASAGCFSRVGGDPFLKNNCESSQAVFLPMDVDATYNYAVSIYGQGWVDASGRRRTIWCTSNTLFSTGYIVGTAWAQLPQNGSFGGAQVITLPSSNTPVYRAGDGIYAWCLMEQNTRIWTYGWN